MKMDSSATFPRIHHLQSLRRPCRRRAPKPAEKSAFVHTITIACFKLRVSSSLILLTLPKLKMPVLRSATRQASREAVAKPIKRATKAENPATTKRQAKKPNAEGSEAEQGPVKLIASPKKSKAKVMIQEEAPRPLNPEPAPPPLPAVLSFSFADAKAYLIKNDPRFEDLFTKLECRPFQHLVSVDPFR